MMYMLTPNYEPQKTNQRKKSNKRKQVKQARVKPALKLTLCILLVMILMLTAWIQEKTSAGDRETNSAVQDFILLAQWGDQLLQGGALAEEWSFRWELTLLQGTMEQLADKLFISDRGVRIPKEIRERGNVIAGAALLPASQLQLVRTQKDQIAEKVTVTLQVKGSELEQFSELKHSIIKLHQRLLSEDQHVQMSMKVYGQPKNEKALDSLKQLAIAQVVDEYVDRGTTSVTLFSSRIKQYLWINNEKMANLQASLHKSSVDEGEFTLTIGIPLISGEFGAIQNYLTE